MRSGTLSRSPRAARRGSVLIIVLVLVGISLARAANKIISELPPVTVEEHAQLKKEVEQTTPKHDPDKVVEEYGADSLRLYEMFMGPLEAVKPWSMSGVSGVRSFLDRVWRMMIDGPVVEARLWKSVDGMGKIEPKKELDG